MSFQELINTPIDQLKQKDMDQVRSNQQCKNCVDCDFCLRCVDCIACINCNYCVSCIGISNAKNQTYVAFGVQLTETTYKMFLTKYLNEK